MTSHAQFYADRIAIALRSLAPNGRLVPPEVPHINALAASFAQRAEAEAVAIVDPKWIEVARSLIGQREIPGPRHNSWIATGWARLGARWFNDDETPWCGFFVAHCLEAAGMPYPGRGEFARALAWSSYGRGLQRAAVGAIGVKKRRGGGHVFFIIGETPDKRFFKVIEGNANNMVRIGDVLKADVIAIRWPPADMIELPASRILPVMDFGTIAETEA